MESCANCGAEMTSARVCRSCGLVADAPEMTLRPPRGEDLDEPNREESRVRADRFAPSNLAVHDFGLGSHFRDFDEEDVDEEKRWLFTRMRTLNEKLADGDARLLRAAMCSIDALGELLNLADPVERRVAYLYRKAREEDLAMDRDLRAVLGALIAVATREMGVPRAREEIMEEANKLSPAHPQIGMNYSRSKDKDISVSELRKVERDVKDALDLDVLAPGPEQYAVRFATKVGLHSKKASLAARICRFVDTDELSRDPKLAAAAVLYRVAKEELTIAGIAERLPIGHTRRLSTMAGKVADLIIDRFYDSVEVTGAGTSEEPGWLERGMQGPEMRLDEGKASEGKILLSDLLKEEGTRSAWSDGPLADELANLRVKDLLLERHRKDSDDPAFE